MEVLAYDLFWDDTYASTHKIRYVLPEEIFADCDYISLHLPLTEKTRTIANREVPMKMKSEAVLINTARGELIDEPDGNRKTAADAKK